VITMPARQVIVRPAVLADCDGIAQAHMASIQSLGATAYGPEIVSDWSAHRTGERYARGIEKGECFFIAVEPQEGTDERIVGFSSYRFEKGKHRTAVYVLGDVARRGVGTALFNAAEGAARQHGAAEIHLDASLAAVAFYKANGFEELGAGEHELKSGRRMACVFMRKRL
jgi:putative acetyltransferase